MELPEKLETFSVVFIAFSESTLNFDHFEKKDEPHGPSISEVFDSKKRLYLHT